MRAATFTFYDSLGVLRTISDAPRAGSGEARVRAEASGSEFAGVVDRVGKGVTVFSAGNEVLGFTTPNSFLEIRLAPV
jgi:NADPH:quinone reductase-like Zn-dependent oxidoreductase